MATNYTGTPTATQSPASAPGSGVAPIVSLPADADGGTWGNAYQSLKTLADYSAYLMQRDAELINDDFLRPTIDAGIWTLGLSGGGANPTIVSDSANGGYGALNPAATAGTSFATSVTVKIGTSNFGFSSRVRVAAGGDAENLNTYGANNIISVGGVSVVSFGTGVTNWFANINAAAHDTGVAYGTGYRRLAMVRLNGTAYFYIDNVLVYSEANTQDLGTVSMQAKAVFATSQGSMFNDTLRLWVAR